MLPETVVWILVIMVSLVVGFLIGWLLEYYLDLKYWEIRAKRRGLVLMAEERSDIPASPAAHEIDTTGEQLAVTLRDLLQEREHEIKALRQEQEKTKDNYEGLNRQFQQYMTTHPDDLTAIRGVGRIYQWKLRDAGIASFEQLASSTPERLREILEVPAWRKFEPEVWIEQARVLAQRGG
ncbi:MAG: hypothetical protein ACOYZ7_08650 [Chloroflexota bacterium]